MHAMYSCWCKNPPSAQAILSGWTPAEERQQAELTPMQISHKKFLEELRAKSGNATNS